jgi:hypothetical protein
MKKKCKTCQLELDLSSFSKNGKYYRTQCKSCCKQICDSRKYHLKDSYKNKKKQYRLNNKNKIKNWHKDYYVNNKEKLLEQSRETYKKNKEKVCARTKVYRETNKEWYRETKRKWRQKPENKLKGNISRGIWGCLRGKQKSTKSIKYLGCFIEELWIHLEKSFEEGMTRENYGEWHVDHIKPLASFDFTKEDSEEQLMIAWNYKNLQPLWAKDNLSKGRTV